MARRKLTDVEERGISILHDYKTTFKSPHGKRVLQDLMKKAGFLELNYVPSDSHGTAFNEGARNLVLHILRKLKVNIKQLQQQLSEDEDELI